MKTFSKVPGEEHLRPIDCPVCGAGEYRSHWTYDGFSFVRCAGCGLLYQNPQPVHDQLTLRYDEEYFRYERENEEAFFGLMKLALSDIRFDSVVGTPASRGGMSVLDVGCATGKLLEWMAERGWSVQGVEVCRPAAEFGTAKRGVPIHIGTLETAGFQSGRFDVAHCSHLIEHLTDPGAFVREVYRMLCDGGWFVLTTPNVDGLQARLFGSEWRSAIADHMTLFSRRTLRRLIEGAGFRVVKTKTWGGLAVGPAPPVVKKAMDRAAKPLGFGDVMIVLARKVTT